MKYYIPTSSINIESILSTESISPISYYAERPFGSNFFQRIKHVNMDSYLYLFSQVPLFTIFDTEIEQYSIAIEIDDDDQLRKLNTRMVYDGKDFSIRSCSKTIVLTPWNCRIIYFDERAYNQSRLTIETSRNSKIGHRYPWVYCKEGTLLEDLAAKINEDLPEEKPDDLSFNVEKGAVWGYVLGSFRSISEIAAKLVSISNRMRNIASNAISNYGECGSRFYNELKELDKAYRDIADRETYEQWNQLCPPEEKSILEKFQVLKEAFCNFIKIRHLNLTPEIPYSKDSKDRWISYRNALNIYTEEFVNNERQSSSSVQLDEISLYDGHLSLNNYELINCILRKISQGELNKEQIRVNRQSSMKIILSEISAILQKRHGQEVWNQNPEERVYINQLFKNATDFEPFDLNSVNNDELKAIAAFLLKGEDYNALIRYLEDNSTANYKLVLFLWGALEGYASIHKIPLSQVLSAENVCLVNILFGIQTTNMPFPSNVYTPRPLSFNQTKEQQREVTTNNEANLRKAPIVPYDNVAELKDNTSAKELEDAFISFFTLLIDNCPAAKNDKEIYHQLFFQHSGLTEDFFNSINAEKSLNKGNGVQKKVIKFLKKHIEDSSMAKTKSKIESTSLFLNSVIEDDHASVIVEKICQELPIADLIVTNFKEFQKEYREGGYYFKRQDSHKNSDVIEHFRSWCFSDRNRHGRITHSYENDNIMNLIVDELKKVYAN